MEIWKSVTGYEGLYEVSNLGRVKSLFRHDGTGRPVQEKILSQTPVTNQNKYHRVKLSKEGKSKTFKVHHLVSGAFLNHIPDGTHNVVIDHIDNDKTNNATNNLRLISHRENTLITGSSKYRGVSWNSKLQKWKSQITIGDNTQYLGYFSKEIEAANAYRNALPGFKPGTS